VINEQPLGKLVIRDQGFSNLSGKVIRRILETSPSQYTSVDLSLNNFGAGGLEDLVEGVQ
jgi:hypothetical protein